MKRIRIALEVAGALALIGALVVVGLIVRDAFFRRERINRATRDDVLFVLNHGGISTIQDLKIIGSYQSARSFTGDYFDAYCMQLSNFEVNTESKDYWHDGLELNPLLADALESGDTEAHHRLDCFPSDGDVKSGAMRIAFNLVVLHDRKANQAEITLYDPRNGRLYFVGYKN